MVTAKALQDVLSTSQGCSLLWVDDFISPRMIVCEITEFFIIESFLNRVAKLYIAEAFHGRLL